MSDDIILDNAHLERLDRIIITPSINDKLMDWRDHNKNLVHHFNAVLSEGLITYELDDKTIVPLWQYFKSPTDEVEGQMIMLAMPKYGDQYPLAIYTFEKTVTSQGGLQIVAEYFHPDCYEKLSMSKDEIIQNTLTVYCSLMAYMEHYKEIKERVSSAIVSFTKTKKPKKGHAKKRVVRAHRVEFRISMPEDTPNSEGRSFTRHVEAWGVKGHPRKYKTGKEIFIKPFVKGKGSRTPKEYKI